MQKKKTSKFGIEEKLGTGCAWENQTTSRWELENCHPRIKTSHYNLHYSTDQAATTNNRTKKNSSSSSSQSTISCHNVINECRTKSSRKKKKNRRGHEQMVLNLVSFVYMRYWKCNLQIDTVITTASRINETLLSTRFKSRKHQRVIHESFFFVIDPRCWV